MMVSHSVELIGLYLNHDLRYEKILAHSVPWDSKRWVFYSYIWQGVPDTEMTMQVVSQTCFLQIWKLFTVHDRQCEKQKMFKLVANTDALIYV